MTQTKSTHSERPFMYAFVVLVRHWRFLATISVFAILASGVIAFLVPNTYRATASFLPPQRQSNLLESVTSGLSSTLKSFGLAKSNLGVSGIYSYLSVLESRMMNERIVKKFDLAKVYGISSGSMERTLKQLSERIEINFEDQGHITVSVEDADPKRAMEMANTYVEFLNDINTRLGTSEAYSNRVFLEQQYKETVNSLRIVEDSFVVFQKRTNIFSLPDQSKAMLTAAANTYAQVMYQQVAVGVAERMFGKDDADVQFKKTQLQEMEKVMGKGGVAQTSFGDLLPAMKDISKEGMEYMRLYRDYEIYSKFLGLLLPMYQQAKVDEHRQSQAVVLLDPATVPEYKFKPKRSVIILISTMSVLALGILFVLIRDRFAMYRSQHVEEWSAMRDAFRKKS